MLNHYILSCQVLVLIIRSLLSLALGPVIEGLRLCACARLRLIVEQALDVRIALVLEEVLLCQLPPR